MLTSEDDDGQFVTHGEHERIVVGLDEVAERTVVTTLPAVLTRGELHEGGLRTIVRHEDERVVHDASAIRAFDLRNLGHVSPRSFSITK